jgi:hypothetical protein
MNDPGLHAVATAVIEINLAMPVEHQRRRGAEVLLHIEPGQRLGLEAGNERPMALLRVH